MERNTYRWPREAMFSVLGSSNLERRLPNDAQIGCHRSSPPRSHRNSSRPCQARYTISDEVAGGPGSPDVVVLHDNIAGAEAAIAPSQGGELSSYRVKVLGQSIELIYRARDYGPQPGFRGKASNLWPAVGAQYPVDTIPKQSCGDGTYVVAGKTYPMPCHGFAKDLAWKEVSRRADSNSAQVTIELTDSQRTRTFYPFVFKLDATYQLSNGQLTINYQVTSGAVNKEPMPFSIGNHIAFKIPFVEGTDPADMTFETPNTTLLLHNPSGAGLSGKEEQRSFETPLRLGDFDSRSALSLAGYRSQPYALLVDPKGVSVRITQTASTSLPEQLVRFNAFGGPHEGYFCPEPWFGRQNSLNQHEGMISLAAGQSWKWRIQLVVSGPPPGMNGSEPRCGEIRRQLRLRGRPCLGQAGLPAIQRYPRFSHPQDDGACHTEIYRHFTNAANGNSMDVEGRLYSCEKEGRRVVRMEKDGTITVIAQDFEGKRINDPNDVVVRRDGQVYFSDPNPKGGLEPLELGYAGVYHVAPDGNDFADKEDALSQRGCAHTGRKNPLHCRYSGARRLRL